MIRQALVEYIANALWQIPLLAAGAWLSLRAIRPGVKTQHGVWLAALALAALLPLHGSVFGDRSAGGQQETQSSNVHVVDTLYVPPVQDRWQPVAREWLATSPRMHRIRLAAGAVDWVVGVYAASVMFGVFRIVRAWYVARHLVKTSWETTLSCEHSAAFFADYAERFGVRLPRLRESCEVSSPMIVGMVRPVLLLPEGFGLRAEAEVKAALCHELAHVRRRDSLVNFACRVVALPVAWHPVTHTIQERIRRTREMVCDAMAAEEMKSETAYARCLLAMARSIVARDRLEETMGLGLFGNNNVLEERIMRLTETKTVVSMWTKITRVASGVSAMTAATVMASMFHVVPTMAASNAAAMQNAQAVQPQQAASGVSNPDAAVTQENGAQAESRTRGPHKKEVARKPFVVVDGQRRELTPEEKARIDKEIADAKQQAHEAMEKFNGPEFQARLKEQMKDVQKQVEESQRQIAKSNAWMNSPEFKKQIEDAQKRATEMHAWVNSPEFRKRMEDQQKMSADMQEMQRIRTEAMKGVMEKMNSPEYRKQMEEMQRMVAEATAKLNDPAMRERMEEMSRRIQEEQKRRTDEMMRRFNEHKEHPPEPENSAPENFEKFLM